MATEKVKKSKLNPVVKSGKNFRKSDEIEKFYRFIFDNDLRREAKLILERVSSLNKKVFAKKIQ